jgi:hypothetical protein
MARIATHPRPSYPWRRIIFVGVAALLAIVFLLVFGGLFAALSPWLPPDAADPGAVIHRWHDAQWGALAGVLFGGSLLALTRRPLAKPLLLQFLVLATAIVALLRIAFVAPGSSLFLIPLLQLFAAYPAPRSLLDWSRPARFSLVLLLLTAVLAVLLAPDIWRAWQLQHVSADPHAQAGHWILSISVEVVLILAGVLSATKRPGWQALSVVTGLALIYLGLAAIATPGYAGSWGMLGGALSTLGGWAFLGAMIWETRRAG